VQTPAAHAAKTATRDIPIVVMAGDPIATGLITNLARPDGNLTGLSATAAEAAAKSRADSRNHTGSAPSGCSRQCRRPIHETVFRTDPTGRARYTP
jgi:hypothetical protein